MASDTPQPPARRRRRHMRSLNWTPEQVEQAAQVGPEDADAVAAWFDKHSPKIARGLLEAREEEPSE